MERKISLPLECLTSNVLKCMLGFFLLFLFSFQAYSQKDSLYVDESVILNKLQTEAAKIIQRGNFLSPEEAAAGLSNNVGKKISLQPIKKQEKVLSPPQIAEQIKVSTVIFARVYKNTQSGLHSLGLASGYIIGEEGICVTNYHVIENYADKKNQNLSLQIMTADEKVYPVTEVLAASKEADIAILKVNTNGASLVPLPLGDAAIVGDPVFVLSHPRKRLYYFTSGIVARNYLKPLTAKLKVPEMDITADFAAGSSGAPVVDNKGNLIGTVSTSYSIYYKEKEKENLQMVVKGTKPVVLLKRMLGFQL